MCVGGQTFEPTSCWLVPCSQAEDVIKFKQLKSTKYKLQGSHLDSHRLHATQQEMD